MECFLWEPHARQKLPLHFYEMKLKWPQVPRVMINGRQISGRDRFCYIKVLISFPIFLSMKWVKVTQNMTSWISSRQDLRWVMPSLMGLAQEKWPHKTDEILRLCSCGQWIWKVLISKSEKHSGAIKAALRLVWRPKRLPHVWYVFPDR